MTVIQLQLNLWDQLAQAQRSPQEANWQQLCLAFDTAIDRTPVGLRLATAADAISQMADVLAARAEAFGADWLRKPGDGPVMDFSEFVRQSLSLDLSELVAVPELYVRSGVEKVHGDGESVVEEVSKQELLDLLEPESQLEPLPLLELEHDESIPEWVAIVKGWMERKQGKDVTLAELLEGVNLPAVKCWLGVLLGGFGLHLNETKGFYDLERVAIALPNPDPQAIPQVAIASALASQ